MRKFLSMLEHKMEVAKEDSDFSYFFSLLITGEAITKLVTLITACALTTNIDRHQYRILYGIVRASGIGDWSKAIDDLLVGPASQYLAVEFREFQSEITKKTSESEWQHIAVNEMILTLNELNLNVDSLPGKKDLKLWFKLFTELRNKTRGHGALVTDKISRASIHLEKSIRLIIQNLNLLKIPTAYLKRNLSGKYRVTEIGGGIADFAKLKKNDHVSLEDGVYIYLGEYRKVPLIISDPDLIDFYISNGSFTNKKYELLSYCTDDKKLGDSSVYLAPKGVLPASESEGLGELQAIGNCFTNVPNLSYEYIQREELEDQLYSLLLDDRRTVVTLLGRGGIGKTSLALRVIPRLYKAVRFDAVIWFSSRDIDLQAGGAKLVTANVVTDKDISNYYCTLVLSEDDKKDKKLYSMKYFQEQLTSSGIGPCLFVFDNFETTYNPTEVFKWIDTYIRNPNKILITTRLREFIGDYPVNIHGMTQVESEKLIRLTADNIGVQGHLTENLIEDIYNVSAGHPYIIKIMLGELAKNNMKGSLPKIIAGSEEVLTALFERTYSALTPCAQRVFLTLSAWNSAVPRLALEAVLMVSIDDPLEVERSIETLLQYSLAEEFKSDVVDQNFVALPFTAMSFGAKKLRVNPLKSTITGDVRVLQKFGPEKIENNRISLDRHLSLFLSSLDKPKKDYKIHKELIEKIGISYIDSWLLIAQWLEESGDIELCKVAQKYLFLYLESETSENKKVVTWNRLAELSRKLKLPLEEIHSLIEASQYSEVNFSDLSNVVNKVNHMLSKQELVLESNDEKKELLSRIYEVVWRRKSEGDAVDFSRMAWLALHLDKTDNAKVLVESGLLKDPYNRHCQKLKEKLDKQESINPTYH